LDAVVELVDQVFRSEGPPIIRQEFPQLFSPDNVQDLYVMLQDGVPVSHIGVYEQDMQIGPATIATGCVGAVGTHPDHRKKGYAGATLACAIHTMRSDGVVLMPVSGRRSLYTRAGCATVGRAYGQKRSLKELTRLACDRYQAAAWEESHLPAVMALHQLEPVRYQWPAEDVAVLVRENLATSCSAFVALDGKELMAWVLIRHFGPMAHYGEGVGRLIDYTGVREAVWSAVVEGMKTIGLKELQFSVPFHDLTSLQLLKGQGLQGQSGGIGGTYKIVDLVGLVDALTPYLLERLSVEEWTDFTIETAGVVEDAQFISDKIRFAFGDEELVVDDPLVATQVIFSPREDWVEAVGPVPEALAQVLARVFPVPLPPYGINYI
jgi:GNAT superfamily N-acetyltransferase